MADKLKNEMKDPLEQITALLPKTPVDASTFSLAVCRRLLSSHAECGRTLLDPIRARQAELINAALVQDTDNALLKQPTTPICPSVIVSGMLLAHNGYIGKVVKVERYECKRIELEPFVYVAKMEYVCGDLDMHKYFTSTINHGTARGYLSSQQGNRNASFAQVLTND